MHRASRRLFELYFLLTIAISMCAQQPPITKPSPQPLQLASLRPGQQMLWRRVSPAPGQTDGPVLYTIIMRSSATPNYIPRIANNYTLTNAEIIDDGTTVTTGGLSIVASTGRILTFANGQVFPGTMPFSLYYAQTNEPAL